MSNWSLLTVYLFCLPWKCWGVLSCVQLPPPLRINSGSGQDQERSSCRDSSQGPRWQYAWCMASHVKKWDTCWKSSELNPWRTKPMWMWLKHCLTPLTYNVAILWMPITPDWSWVSLDQPRHIIPWLPSWWRLSGHAPMGFFMLPTKRNLSWCAALVDGIWVLTNQKTAAYIRAKMCPSPP